MGSSNRYLHKTAASRWAGGETQQGVEQEHCDVLCGPTKQHTWCPDKVPGKKSIHILNWGFLASVALLNVT